MATIRVRSTDGNDADDGTTWALAKATLTGAAAIDAAGDTIVVSSVHAESTAAAVSINLAGSLASPTRILSVDDSADPPTALLPGATITTTGASPITLPDNTSRYLFLEGLIFNCGTGASNANLTIQGRTLAQGCSFFLLNTGSGSVIRLGLGHQEIIDCSFKFSAAGQGFYLEADGPPRRITGGWIAAGGANITTLVNTILAGGRAVFEGFDMSALSAALDMCSVTTTGVALEFRQCILPPSWSGSVHTGFPGRGALFEMFSCWSGATEIIWRRKTETGAGRDETTLVRTGGGKHRGVGVSLKCDTNADAEYPLNTFDTPQFAAQVTAAQVGSPVTATVEILHDSATAMTDADIWLTVVGPEDEVNSDQVADVFATPANQASSSATWTTTGMANPNKQKLTVTWTPAKAGVVLGTVSIAAPSKTVYVDNMMSVAA